MSETKEITFGIPQGSILGPLLFILYFRDLHRSLKHSYNILSADYTNICIKNTHYETLINNLNDDLQNVAIFLKSNTLCLIINKTHYIYMVFGIGRRKQDNELKVIIDINEINKVDCTKFLSVIIDQKL